MGWAVAVVSGGDKLERALAEIAKKLGNKPTSVSVGFLDGATEASGVSVAQIAAINNFGAPSRGIPPRPFFTNMVATKSGEWADGLAQALVATDNDAPKALAIMGEGIAGQLREAIIATDSPPNSPVTNLLKQRFPTGGQTFEDVLKARRDVAAGATAPAGKPLVQSGGMLGAVDYEVKS